MTTDHRRKIFRLTMFLAAILLLVKVTRKKEEPLVLNQSTGLTMGTIGYTVKYLHSEKIDLGFGIDSVLKALNQSQSTYLKDSEISLFNRMDTLVYTSDLFFPVLTKSALIFEKTNGAFDPTVGPVINAWGFGPGKQANALNKEKVDSLLEFVGFSKIKFNEQYATKPTGMYLDLSAIAKGYAVDLVGQYLHTKGMANFMIEIGGEVLTRGLNEKGKPWSIGIENPLVNKDEQELLAVVSMENMALATSGNYRNYFEKEGQIYAHIIDPRTGYNSNQTILSASVFAASCMEADAYATAFMVMGVEESKKLLDDFAGLSALLIYTNEETGKTEIFVSEGIKNKVRMIDDTL